MYLYLRACFIFYLLVGPCFGQGMVAVPTNEGDEKGAEENKNTLSPQKIGAHVKIATAHLQQEQRDGQDDDRISVKDKPISLQNPDKHASDEFILTFLLAQYPLLDSAEDQVEILQNLENFSHKWENGRDLFKATGALQEILLPALNSSHDSVRRSACAVFAIASQNNREVQEVVASESGVIRRLIHLISFDSLARSKALWALSALVRNFRKGQSKFISDGGIPAIVKVASFSETRKRCLNFVTDLLQEGNYCREPDGLDNDLSSCDEFQVLEKHLKEAGWCDVILDSVKNIPGFDTEDQLHTVEAVAGSLPMCRKVVAEHINIFQGLESKLSKLGDEWVDEAKVVRDIMDGMKDMKRVDDEL